MTKNKTTLIKNFLCFFLLVNLLGCTKLKDKSSSLIIASQFNPTPEDLASLVGAAYVDWRYILNDWNGVWRAQEVSANGIVIPARPNGWVDGGVYRRIHEHKWTADDEISGNAWSRTYRGITKCNRIIYQIESGGIQVTSGKEATLAELKVLRASYYYILCDIFGNVPIVDKFDLPEGFLPKQSTRKEVYDFIVKEIADNVGKLSDKNDGTTYGRFNQWAAHTLLANQTYLQ